MVFSWPRIAKATFISLLVIGLGQFITSIISTAYTRVLFHNLGSVDAVIYFFSQPQYKLVVYLLTLVSWTAFIVGGWLFVKLSKTYNWWLGTIPGFAWFFLATTFITIFMTYDPARLIQSDWERIILARREYFDHFFNLGKAFQLCLWGGLSGLGGYLGYKLK